MSIKIKLLKNLSNYFYSEENRSNHFWEYYNRLNYVSNQIKEYNLDSYTVLDIGGVPGNNLLSRFGIKEVTTLDINENADIVASADKIPLEDNTFDFVTCLDTFEHLPNEIRLNALDEIIRVAKVAAFIVAPIDTEENNRAEELVIKYNPVDFLLEHRKYGLVNFTDIENRLDKLKKEGKINIYEEYYMDNLLTWVCLMVEFRVSASQIYNEAYFLENDFYPRRKALKIII